MDCSDGLTHSPSDSLSHMKREAILPSTMITKMIRVTMVGLIKSQKTISDRLHEDVRKLKIAPHLLHCTFFGRPALRNRTAKIPPTKNTPQLNEPLKSTAGLQSYDTLQTGQRTFCNGRGTLAPQPAGGKSVPHSLPTADAKSRSQPLSLQIFMFPVRDLSFHPFLTENRANVTGKDPANDANCLWSAALRFHHQVQSSSQSY